MKRKGHPGEDTQGAPNPANVHRVYPAELRKWLPEQKAEVLDAILDLCLTKSLSDLRQVLSRCNLCSCVAPDHIQEQPALDFNGLCNCVIESTPTLSKYNIKQKIQLNVLLTKANINSCEKISDFKTQRNTFAEKLKFVLAKNKSMNLEELLTEVTDSGSYSEILSFVCALLIWNSHPKDDISEFRKIEKLFVRVTQNLIRAMGSYLIPFGTKRVWIQEIDNKSLELYYSETCSNPSCPDQRKSCKEFVENLFTNSMAHSTFCKHTRK
jgi:hypothetical protein